MPYNILTKELLAESLKTDIPKDKDWVAWTNLEGMMEFDMALKKEITRGELKHQ